MNSHVIGGIHDGLQTMSKKRRLENIQPMGGVTMNVQQEGGADIDDVGQESSVGIVAVDDVEQESGSAAMEEEVMHASAMEVNTVDYVGSTSEEEGEYDGVSDVYHNFEEEGNLEVDVVTENDSEEEYEKEEDTEIDEIDEVSNYLEDHLETVSEPLEVDLTMGNGNNEEGYNSLNIELKMVMRECKIGKSAQELLIQWFNKYLMHPEGGKGMYTLKIQCC